MSARLALVASLVAVGALGCGHDEGHALVTLTDLVVVPAANGEIKSGTFKIHIARPADATGASHIRIHTLQLGGDSVGGSTLPLFVTSLAGQSSDAVEPGAEIVRTMTFGLAQPGSAAASPFVPCASPTEGFFLTGIYYDDAEEAFFPLKSAPSWLPSKRLDGTTWSETFGDSLAQIESDVAAFPDGTSVIVGSTQGKVDFQEPAGSPDALAQPFILKLDSAGAPLWRRIFPVASIDLWHSWREGPSLVAAGPDGSTVVAGTFEGSLDLGGGPIQSAGGSDVILARLDPSGKTISTRRFGDALNQTVTTMDVDATGHVVLVGTIEGAIDFGAGPVAPLIDPTVASFYVATLPEAGPPVHAGVPLVLANPVGMVAAVGGDGAVVLGGAFTGKAWIGPAPPQDSPMQSGILVALTPAGTVAWSQVVLGAVVTQVAIDQQDIVATVRVDSPVILGGVPVPSGERGTLVLARFDPLGALRYAVPIGGSGAVTVGSLVIDSAGHALLSGTLLGALTLAGSTAVADAPPTSFFAEIDRQGAHVRSRAFGCSTAPVDLAVAHQGARDVVLAATFSGAIDVGKGEVSTAGSTDLLVAKLPAQ